MSGYPGARVDTDAPIYQLYDKEIWEDFTFKERYAGWKELRRYFEHVDKKWNLREQFEFNKNVDTATFDEDQRKWVIECSDGSQTWCRWYGISSHSLFLSPNFRGLSLYETLADHGY